MLQYETIDVACGANHVIAITGNLKMIMIHLSLSLSLPLPLSLSPLADHTVHSWGRNENGNK